VADAGVETVSDFAADSFDASTSDVVNAEFDTSADLTEG
jgi:hypothetical protein